MITCSESTLYLVGSFGQFNRVCDIPPFPKILFSPLYFLSFLLSQAVSLSIILFIDTYASFWILYNSQVVLQICCFCFSFCPPSLCSLLLHSLSVLSLSVFQSPFIFIYFPLILFICIRQTHSLTLSFSSSISLSLCLSLFLSLSLSLSLSLLSIYTTIIIYLIFSLFIHLYFWFSRFSLYFGC